MKSTVPKKPCVAPAVVYPCLLISEHGRVILFSRDGKVGTQVNDTFAEMGRAEILSKWERVTGTSLEPFTGSICLEND